MIDSIHKNLRGDYNMSQVNFKAYLRKLFQWLTYGVAKEYNILLLRLTGLLHLEKQPWKIPDGK